MTTTKTGQGNEKIADLWRYTIVLSRSRGKMNIFINACKEQIEKSGQVIIPTTDPMIAKRYWRMLKNKGCNCKYDPIYEGAGNKLETIYDNNCEPLFVYAPKKKLTGYMFYK